MNPSISASESLLLSKYSASSTQSKGRNSSQKTPTKDALPMRKSQSEMKSNAANFLAKKKALESQFTQSLSVAKEKRKKEEDINQSSTSLHSSTHSSPPSSVNMAPRKKLTFKINKSALKKHSALYAAAKASEPSQSPSGVPRDPHSHSLSASRAAASAIVNRIESKGPVTASSMKRRTKKKSATDRKRERDVALLAERERDRERQREVKKMRIIDSVRKSSRVVGYEEESHSLQAEKDEQSTEREREESGGARVGDSQSAQHSSSSFPLSDALPASQPVSVSVVGSTTPPGLPPSLIAPATPPGLPPGMIAHTERERDAEREREVDVEREREREREIDVGVEIEKNTTTHTHTQAVQSQSSGSGRAAPTREHSHSVSDTLSPPSQEPLSPYSSSLLSLSSLPKNLQQNPCEILVGNLPKFSEKDELANFLASCGPIARIEGSRVFPGVARVTFFRAKIVLCCSVSVWYYHELFSWWLFSCCYCPWSL